MHGMIERAHDSKQLTISAAGTTSTVASVAGFSAGTLHVPTGFEGTSLSIQVGPEIGAMKSLYDHAGTQITLTVAAGRRVFLPAECFATRYVKFVASTQAAARTLTLDLVT